MQGVTKALRLKSDGIFLTLHVSISVLKIQNVDILSAHCVCTVSMDLQSLLFQNVIKYVLGSYMGMGTVVMQTKFKRKVTEMSSTAFPQEW